MTASTTRGVGWFRLFALCATVSACGGNESPPSNTPPVPVITSPAAGATLKAGDTLTFAASASDAEDGTLAAASLTWWADLHHDTHTHPFVQPTVGASGSATIPTRGETSSNIFYRVHLRATDSGGLSTEVTRDVQLQKAQITLASQPTGLRLTLDGQPVTAPLAVTGVVGIERDLGAAGQTFACRSYQFGAWSDSGAATHTISTPAANTTYIATFVDKGPASNAPTASLTAPASGSTGNVGTPITLTASAADGDGTIAGVQFFDGATAIGAADTTAPYSVSWTPASTGTHTLTARATDDCGLTTTSAPVSVTINATGADTQPPTLAFTAPAALADGLTGSLQITVNASDNVGVTNVEFQVDGVTVANDTSSPYAASVDTATYASGQHVLRVRASDAAGNQSAWVTRAVRFGGSQAMPSGFTRDTSFVTSLSAATTFTQLPDGRLLIAQQGGTLLVRQSNGAAIGTMLTLTVDSQGERGLLGVTPHPNFASNGFIYVYYTTTSGGTHNRISRFTVSGNTASNEQVLVDLPALSATNHNGGALHFGGDGKLYVAVGENAVPSRAPDLTSVFGKMLRFNDDGSIPSDNPFFNTQSGMARAIWAYGLRNPFTFAVRASDGRIHINDVGQSTWEEINVGAAGANYGWPSTEGPTSAAGITGPLYAYDHDSAADNTAGFFNGCAIIGGAFYPDAGPFPQAYRGSYYFTDLCNPVIGRVDLTNGNAAYAFGSVSGSPVGMMVTNDGALLVLTQSGVVRFSTQ